ncbi:MAG: elongation factor P [Nanoarchaeota archaeon]|nr:elongation factor P [Nanoarchaeota archaeon]
MAYSYTELRPGTIFQRNGEPWQVMQADFVRMQQRKAVVQLKIKNLITGTTVTESGHASDSYEEAEVERLPAVFIYERNGEYWFYDVRDKSKRFSLLAETLGKQAEFLKPMTEVFAQKFEEKVIAVELPIKMDLKVTEAPPTIKGNTSAGGNKVVTLETGANVNTPLFIETGDVIRVNTETGEYVERVVKA